MSNTLRANSSRVLALMEQGCTTEICLCKSLIVIAAAVVCEARLQLELPLPYSESIETLMMLNQIGKVAPTLHGHINVLWLVYDQKQSC
jgi:hypothetical protein